MNTNRCRSSQEQHEALIAALETLNEDISNGQELPDAAHRVARKYDVDQYELECWYDQQFEGNR